MSHYWTADDPPAIREAQITDWIDDLIEFGSDTVAQACGDWRRSQTKRPTIADIRERCIEERRSRSEMLALPARELTEQDAERLADKWAQAHGYSGIKAYQAATREGSGVWVGPRWYFGGERKYEVPELPRATTTSGFLSVGAALGVTATERTEEPA